jgi:aconitate hydratase
MTSNIKEQAKKSFEVRGKSYTYYDLKSLEEQGLNTDSSRTRIE